MTPAAVADTDVAETDPLLAFVPSTTTVSPTWSAPRLDLAFLVTVAAGPTVTFTRSPLELVTYSVDPETSVTVPVAAAAPNDPEAPDPVVPEAPALRNNDANDDAADVVDVVPRVRWSAAPPQIPPAAINSPKSTMVGTDTRIPFLGPRTGHSSSSVAFSSHGGSPGPAADATALWPSARGTKIS